MNESRLITVFFGCLLILRDPFLEPRADYVYMVIGARNTRRATFLYRWMMHVTIPGY